MMVVKLLNLPVLLFISFSRSTFSLFSMLIHVHVVKRKTSLFQRMVPLDGTSLIGWT